MQLSIVIPTYREHHGIADLIEYLREHSPSGTTEIIVADYAACDATAAVAARVGAQVVACTRKGRSAQMNAGAAQATGSVLYFLHADSYPPPSFYPDIMQAVSQGCAAGCYRLRFDDRHWALRFFEWFTRFDFTWFRFGDQSLFVQRWAFEAVGGYDEQMLVLEDQDIVKRLSRRGTFRVCRKAVTTSARKFRANGVVRLYTWFFGIYTLYALGLPQRLLIRVYRRFIVHGKV